jgi:hypothetical protein
MLLAESAASPPGSLKPSASMQKPNHYAPPSNAALPQVKSKSHSHAEILE